MPRHKNDGDDDNDNDNPPFIMVSTIVLDLEKKHESVDDDNNNKT